jgi:hypothetical protein
VLIPYDARAANGQWYVKELSDGAYRNEFYVAHISECQVTPYATGILLIVPRHPWGR